MLRGSNFREAGRGLKEEKRLISIYWNPKHPVYCHWEQSHRAYEIIQGRRKATLTSLKEDTNAKDERLREYPPPRESLQGALGRNACSPSCGLPSVWFHGATSNRYSSLSKNLIFSWKYLISYVVSVQQGKDAFARARMFILSIKLNSNWGTRSGALLLSVRGISIFSIASSHPCSRPLQVCLSAVTTCFYFEDVLFVDRTSNPSCPTTSPGREVMPFTLEEVETRWQIDSSFQVLIWVARALHWHH